MGYARSNDSIPADELQLARELAHEGARIQRDNKAFDRLTAAQKRVAIAKDVLQWLDLRRIVPESGTYLRTAADVNKVSDAGSCNACAVGALFACQLERTPKLKLTDLDGYDVKDYNYDTHEYRSTGEREFGSERMREALGKFFSEDQLSLIECAFEGDDGFGDAPYEQRQAAERFGSRYRSDRGRMRAIMENIVANGGTFKPGA